MLVTLVTELLTHELLGVKHILILVDTKLNPIGKRSNSS